MPNHYESPVEPSLNLTAGERAAQAEGLAFFDRAGTAIARLWEFKEGQEPQIPIPPNRVHEIQGTNIKMVWPFVRGAVVLHSPDALRAGVITLGIHYGVLFDSNLYRAIVRFVDAPQALDHKTRDGVAMMLDLVHANNYDYQALPYLVEQYANNKEDVAHAYALKILQALLRLHTMDVEVFRATRRIIPDEHRLQIYAEEYGTSDYVELAVRQLESMQPVRTEPPPLIRLYYHCMMKMALIRRVTAPRGGLRKQLRLFDEFVLNEMGLLLGGARVLALLYFAGALERFIPVQLGGKRDKQLKSLWNSAWDIWLGTLPEQLLASSEEPVATTYFFCTMEADFAKYLLSQATRAVIVEPNGRHSPIRDIEEQLLMRIVGPELDTLLADMEKRTTDHQRDRISGRVKPKRTEEMEELFGRVEAEFLSKIYQ